MPDVNTVSIGVLLLILGVQLILTGLIGELIHFNSKSRSQKAPAIQETL